MPSGATNSEARTLRAACACLLLCMPFSAHAASRGEFALLQQSPASKTYAYTLREVPYSIVLIDGRPHTLYQGESHQTREGDPHLPVDILTLGIPPGSAISAELDNPVYEDLSGLDVAPEPTLMPADNSEFATLYIKNQETYSRNEYLPARVLNVSPPYQLRLQRVVTITLAPYQYNPRSKTVRKLKSARIVVHIAVAAGGASFPALESGGSDPNFEDVYRAVLDNPSEARGFRTRGAVLTRAVLDSSRDWFETGRTYYRIPVSRDGWYRVSAQDVPGIDTATARMYYHGRPVPIVVRPDRSLEFYGHRHRGDSTELDYFTDTSSYWLTWGGIQTGLRFVTAAAPSGPPVDTIPSTPFTTHYEENTDYYEGTTQAEITLNGTVAGEGWAWEYYYPGSTSNHTFAVSGIDSVRGPTAKLRVKLQSTTLHYNTPDHRVQIWVNDSLAGQRDLNGREGALIDLTFPARWLREGTNVLRLSSVPTASNPNQFYLDWYEVQYQHFHTAMDGVALVAVPGTGAPRDVVITAQGFRDPEVEVYDLSANRKIPVSLAGGDSTTGYSIRFLDSVGVSKTYLAVAANAALPATGLQPKVFRDIRASATGADYIIVTHAEFIAAAQRLAAHRATFNGVRAAVVDVQDIYDEFNFGHLSTDPMKEFLKYAYRQWPGTPPSAVLMFGDASWDYHRYMATTIKTNFVPGYGVPAGDNWFVCFDSTYAFLPSMLIGRISVQDPMQAESAVDKLIQFDQGHPADWNKNFMFISGGTSPAEQASFDATTASTIDAYITPAPIGGTAIKILKTTPDAIDGEHTKEMREYVKQGLAYINYLGHSGGRVWGVTIGDPHTLENTEGQLPFVSSVSCNIGSFAEPSSNVLAEDFVLARNSGGIGAWASSSLGYANIGSTLVNLFLTNIIRDSGRGLGALTTASRIQMWQQRGSDYVSIASVNLNPLIGDPLTSFVLAKRPELELSPRDLTTNAADPNSGDSVLTVRVDLHNYGLVPPDSIGISVSDTYGSATRQLLDGTRIRPIMHRDSVLLPWPVLREPGVHTLTGVVDPGGLILEVDESNNSATVQEYVFGQNLVIVRPFDNMVVRPGPQTIVVTSQKANDTVGTTYEFEVDSSSAFDSPALVKSGQVTGGPVGGRWTTPQLPIGGTWFCRVRTVQNSVVGQWVSAAFVISGDAPVLPSARWRQVSANQFSRGTMAGTAVTDSGVTLSGRPPFNILARSLGYRADMGKEYYSILRMNDQTMIGYWWVNGNSFMVLRADEVTGAYEFRPFNVASDPAKATEMAEYLNSVHSMEAVAMVVVLDGYTNVTPALQQAIRALGSTMIDSVRPGHSWMMISRKGPNALRMPVLEHWSPDGVAIDSVTLENYYTVGNGQIQSPAFPYPAAWTGLHVRGQAPQGVTAIRTRIVGSRMTGNQDTLFTAPGDSLDIDLASLSGRVLGDSSIPGVSLEARLSTGDGITTPVLRDWWIDLQPPQELVIGPRTVEIPTAPVAKGEALELPITVHNIGYRTSTASTVQVILSVESNPPVTAAEVPLDTIPPDASRRVLAPIQTSALSGTMTATVRVIPRPESHDLIGGNNRVQFPLTVVSGAPTKLVLYADGTQLMDGDYVSIRPNLVVQLKGSVFDPSRDRAELYVDEKATGSSNTSGAVEVASVLAGDPTFSPLLSEGQHSLQVVLIKGNIIGPPDTVVQRLTVNVEGRFRILNLFNYPNPFERETYFTFVLAGAQAPDEVRIRIYTVAGRKIQQITVPGAQAQIGFNRIPWDGRDAEGDEIANGTYLYQVEVRGGDNTVTEIQKLVRLR